jgi:hypothetical protein
MDAWNSAGSSSATGLDVSGNRIYRWREIGSDGIGRKPKVIIATQLTANGEKHQNGPVDPWACPESTYSGCVYPGGAERCPVST